MRTDIYILCGIKDGFYLGIDLVNDFLIRSAACSTLGEILISMLNIIFRGFKTGKVAKYIKA